MLTYHQTTENESMRSTTGNTAETMQSTTILLMKSKRAVRCYEKAGFHIVGDPIHQTTSAGDGVFYHMIREA